MMGGNLDVIDARDDEGLVESAHFCGPQWRISLPTAMLVRLGVSPLGTVPMTKMPVLGESANDAGVYVKDFDAKDYDFVFEELGD